MHGILVQLPLPNHINEPEVLEAILVEKDVDGFSSANIGNMCLRGGRPPLALPCTPAGCVELLQRSEVEISGKDVVVLGRRQRAADRASEAVRSDVPQPV